MDIPKADRSIIVCNDKDLIGCSLPVVCAECGTDLVISQTTRSETPPDADILCLSCFEILVGRTGKENLDVQHLGRLKGTEVLSLIFPEKKE